LLALTERFSVFTRDTLTAENIASGNNSFTKCDGVNINGPVSTSILWVPVHSTSATESVTSTSAKQSVTSTQAVSESSKSGQISRTSIESSTTSSQSSINLQSVTKSTQSPGSSTRLAIKSARPEASTIAGIATGAFAMFMAVAIACWILCRRKFRRTKIPNIEPFITPVPSSAVLLSPHRVSNT
jgi:hypothetical protein